MTPKPIFDWQFAWHILPQLLSALTVTVEAVVFGMAMALVLGLAWALLRRSPRKLISRPISLVVEVIRSTPLLIQLYFLYFVLPEAGITLSPLATGIIGLGIHYSSYTAEVYRAGIEAVPRGQWEAAWALSLSPARTWRAVILPQAIPRVVPVLGNYFIAMFKDTPLLAAITVAELLKTAKIIGAAEFRYLEPLTLIGALFLVISLLASQVVGFLERRYGTSF
ncbi:MAG TPA: ectoine/hydroxyectoine ABC transporter permease subunit EhuD [Kofleriaceae bacterium]|nr:ectoine/hydroxyectoine ABC transporter permease subunit EhuD [Kofleriaceae bacterium]